MGPSVSEAGTDESEDFEALAADLEELDLALQDIDLDDLSTTEAEAMAVEAQKLGQRAGKAHGKSSYKDARARVARGRSNRGWRTDYDNMGTAEIEDKDLQGKLQKLKQRTRCHACGQIGHWTNDKECPQRQSSRGSSFRRTGDFLRRAGLASIALLTGVGGFDIKTFAPTLDENKHLLMDLNFEVTSEYPETVMNYYNMLNNDGDEYVKNVSVDMYDYGVPVMNFGNDNETTATTTCGTTVTTTSTMTTTTTNDTEAYAVSLGVIPIGYAVVDTACLRSCAGSDTLDAHINGNGLITQRKPSNMCFRGVSDKAPIPAESGQEIPAGIGGRRVNLRFQRLRKSRTPMLLSMGILRELGATVDIDDLCITFKGAGQHQGPDEAE